MSEIANFRVWRPPYRPVTRSGRCFVATYPERMPTFLLLDRLVAWRRRSDELARLWWDALPGSKERHAASQWLSRIQRKLVYVWREVKRRQQAGDAEALEYA